MSTNDDSTLGFTLELYSRYMEAARVSTISETPFVVGIHLFMERNLKKIATHKPSHLVILPHFSLVLFVEIFIVLQNDVWIFFL